MPYRNSKDLKENTAGCLDIIVKKLVKMVNKFKIALVFTNSFVSSGFDKEKLNFLDQKTLYSECFFKGFSERFVIK